MNKLAMVAVAAMLIFPSANAANSPPVGNSMGVQQPPKTGNYTIKSTDLRTVVLMNCSAPCTVTMPQSTSSWPKGYPVIIQRIGSATVTVTAITSTIYGLPVTAGNLLMTTSGNWVALTADPSNNYLAYGVLGSGGGGGGGTFAGLGVSATGPSVLGVSASGPSALGVHQ